MNLKGAFKNSSVFIQILLFLTLITGGMMLATLLTMIGIFIQSGGSLEIIQAISQKITDYPDLLREVQFFQIIGLFILPAILSAWLFSDDYRGYLRINTPFSFSIAGLTVLSIFVMSPFINWTHVLNQQMVFPDWLSGIEEWMLKQEEMNNSTIEKMLYSKTIGILLLNILIVCVLTGIGEEFIFRGVIQNIIGKVIKNPHIVIWLVAILFSSIHLQFYGFIPRLLLGAYFGYLLHYTQNIWIPALAHFTNNLISVLMFYILQDTPELNHEIDTMGSGSTWWVGLLSLGLWIVLWIQIQKSAKLQGSFS